MLEYETGEAKDLLTEKHQKAQTTLTQVKEDMEFLKEQITTMEVGDFERYSLYSLISLYHSLGKLFAGT
jgi:hypothetical protein